MAHSPGCRLAGIASTVLLLQAAAAGAQTPTPTPLRSVLPGGASSITEIHGDWTVNCQVVQTAKVCRFSHQQFDRSNASQRLLALELDARADNSAAGTMALPFGLALAQGVALAIDDREVEGPLTFSTCLVVGCLVPVGFDEGTVERLKAGTTLKITATAADSGQPISFSVSLHGFSSALARTASLAAQ